MSNVGCDAGAAMSWIETNEAVEIPPHRFLPVVFRNCYPDGLQSSGLGVAGLPPKIPLPIKPSSI